MFEIQQLVPKKWGFEKWITNKPEYCGKLLYVVKNRSCSLHFHKLKDETFFIASNCISLEFILPDEWTFSENDPLEDYSKLKYNTCILDEGSVFHIPPFTIHRFKAVNGDAKIFEISTQHFDEDSYRIEEGY